MGLRTGADGRRWAEDRLREAIAAGDVAPGQRLIEEEIAARFDVTRSSLRQAVDTLVSEGLVERIQNRGARVRRLSIEDAVEITECRAVLEGLLARKAADRAASSDVDRLRDQVSAMRASLASGDLLKYSRLISELYDDIHDVARHPNASALVERLQAQLVRQQFQLSLRPGRPQTSIRELSDVVDAIASHQADRAEQSMRLHLDGVVAAIRDDSQSHD